VLQHQIWAWKVFLCKKVKRGRRCEQEMGKIGNIFGGIGIGKKIDCPRLGLPTSNISGLF
jgi:hypothetical protein